MIEAHKRLHAQIESTSIELEKKGAMLMEREESTRAEVKEVKERLERERHRLVKTVETLAELEQEGKKLEHARSVALADAMEKTRGKDGVDEELDEVTNSCGGCALPCMECAWICFVKR